MFKFLSAIILTACFASGCTSIEQVCRMEAAYAPGLNADAEMSDPAWKQTPEYRLQCYRNFQHLPEKTVAAIETGKHEVQVSAKLLYDDENLYIGCRIENDDIRTLDQRDQQRHYLTGDVFEIFLKPEKSNAYLELYATPSGNKSAFYFPSRAFGGTILIDQQKLMPGIEVVAKVHGTLNDSSDTDQYWTAVMTISRKAVEKKLGVPLAPGHAWNILLAGYSFSANRTFGVNFSCPLLPQLNYHLYEYYAPLNFR